MTDAVLERLEPRWEGPIIVAATGESLTKKLAIQCMESARPIIAIKQAAERLPTADVLYINDSRYWDMYKGYPEFKGERWSTHQIGRDEKRMVAKRYGIRLVAGEYGETFSDDPSVVHYGNSSGFQAIGLAIHWLKRPGRIIVIGLDMQGRYFFRAHPKWGDNPNPPFHSYGRFFEKAATKLPEGVEIVLGTPSALACFPTMPLEQALAA